MYKLKVNEDALNNNVNPKPTEYMREHNQYTENREDKDNRRKIMLRILLLKESHFQSISDEKPDTSLKPMQPLTLHHIKTWLQKTKLLRLQNEVQCRLYYKVALP